MKVSVLFLTAFGIILCALSAPAFHRGGVGPCDGCHSMHNSPTENAAAGAVPGPSLQRGTDASSTCLSCHNGAGRYHINSADGSNTNEGGDFHWVRDNGYTYVRSAGTVVVDYHNRGHSVVASDFGLAPDINLMAAPGGSYLAADLGCSSCHDPHGQAQGGIAGGAPPISVSGSYGQAPVEGSIPGNYRLLFDAHQAGFVHDAPIARASGDDGASVQYGSGMSSWCANCHPAFYANTATHMHPTDVAVPLTYNGYIATGDFSGDIAKAYDPLVPFERGVLTASSDLPLPRDPATAGFGVDGSSRVMCLSCHRAHASAFANALRWDNSTDAFLADSWVYEQSNVDLAVAAPYYKHGLRIDIENPGSGNPFTDGYGEFQRSLCNKCHAQD